MLKRLLNKVADNVRTLSFLPTLPALNYEDMEKSINAAFPLGYGYEPENVVDKENPEK